MNTESAGICKHYLDLFRQEGPNFYLVDNSKCKQATHRKTIYEEIHRDEFIEPHNPQQQKPGCLSENCASHEEKPILWTKY